MNYIVKWFEEHRNQEQFQNVVARLKATRDKESAIKTNHHEFLDNIIPHLTTIYLRRFIQNDYYLSQEELKIFATLYGIDFILLMRENKGAAAHRTVLPNTRIIYHEGVHFSACEVVQN